MIATRRALYHALKPPPRLTVSEWADRFRMLSPEASAEPGPWRTSRAPYQRAMMDALCDPTIHTVVVMSSAQVGKSELLLNALGYTIDLDPGPTLLIQPTLEMAEAFSKDRLDPMLRDTPVLRQKVRTGRSKDRSNTIRHKTFPGGHVTLAGSNSAAGLASRPIRFVLADEVDRWDTSAGDEGDPLALAGKRTTTFWNRKALVVSTPTIKGASRIEAQFAESDQRQCFVPCPHCQTRFVVQWAHVRWELDDPATAHLVCPSCGALLDEADRHAMLQAPEWRASQPCRGIAGFHIWEGYSLWRRLADIVADFLAARKAPDTLQVFVNTSLGETWEETGEQTDASSLIARREPYPAEVPAGACCLTAGVDVQDDRLEALVMGWGPGEEAWVVESRRIEGDPQRPEPWLALDELLSKSFLHESGTLLDVKGACIDTAGHRTQYVYDYVAKRHSRRVYAVIGRDGADRPIVSAPSQKRSGQDPRKVALFTVGTDACKALIYSRLKLTEKGPGYVHLPLPHQAGGQYRDGVDEEFIAQLTAEKLVTKHKMGVPTRQWVKTRPRNEALDLLVYAIAALRLVRPDLSALARQLAPDAKPAVSPPPPPKWRWIEPRRDWMRGR